MSEYSLVSWIGSIHPHLARWGQYLHLGTGHNILIYCSSQSTELESSSTKCNHRNCYRSLKQVHERVLIQLNLIALSMNIFGHWSKNNLPNTNIQERFWYLHRKDSWHHLYSQGHHMARCQYNFFYHRHQVNRNTLELRTNALFRQVWNCLKMDILNNVSWFCIVF